MTKAEKFIYDVLAMGPIEPIPPEEEEVAETSQYTSIGTFYSLGGEPYILAQVSRSQCALISLDDGNRWNDGIQVERVSQITLEEFKFIAGTENFTKLNIQYRYK